MDDVLGGEDIAPLLQVLEDDRVGLGHGGQHREPVLVEDAPGVHRDLHGDVGGDLLIALADVEVVQAEGRGGVDAAGTGVQGDVVAQNNPGSPGS